MRHISLLRAAAPIIVAAALSSGCSSDKAATPPELPADGHFPTSTQAPVDKPKLPWTILRTEGSRIYFTVTNDHCAFPYTAVVDTNPTTVTIDVFGTDPHEPCTAVGYQTDVWVDVATPIGDRKIVDGSKSS